MIKNFVIEMIIWLICLMQMELIDQYFIIGLVNKFWKIISYVFIEGKHD